MMKRLVLLLCAMFFVQNAFAQITQQFVGTVVTSSNDGGPSFINTPVGATVSGSFIVTTSNFGTPYAVAIGNEWTQDSILPNLDANTDSIMASSDDGSFSASDLQSAILGGDIPSGSSVWRRSAGIGSSGGPGHIMLV